MIVWDEKKRQANLEKHGLDFLRAYLVFNNPNKVTFSSTFKNENRLIDVAMVEMAGRVLTLVYVKRGNDIRVISFRVASRKERERMSSNKDMTDWRRVTAFREGDHIPYDPEDGPYDPNDEAATEAWLSQAIVTRPGQRGLQKSPTKKQVTLRLSPEVLAHFKAKGKGWQTRIDETLKKAIKSKPRRKAS